MKTILFEQGAMGNRKTLQGAAGKFSVKYGRGRGPSTTATKGWDADDLGSGEPHEVKVFLPFLMKQPFVTSHSTK